MCRYVKQWIAGEALGMRLNGGNLGNQVRGGRHKVCVCVPSLLS